MKIKTAELKGQALDMAVALSCGYQAIDHTILCQTWVERVNARGVMTPSPVSSLRFSSDWNLGGPIIETYGITTIRLDDDYGTDAQGYATSERIPVWVATTGQHRIDREEGSPMVWVDGLFYGGSALEAAMRCFVATKLGFEVELPDGVTA